MFINPKSSSYNSMGTYLSQPKTDKKMQLKRFQHCFVTTCEMQGWRKLMEDAIVCQQISKGVQLFCVFDGHGGPEVSLWVARNLPRQLVNQPNFKQKNYSKALTNTFKKIDEMLKSQKGEDQLKKIHCQLNLPSDYDTNHIGYRAGCTANVLLLTKEKIIVANIGDSRSVLCKKGLAIPLSFDHKPDNPEQLQRINNAGGYIKNGRINGQVNLSRAFGDFEYKSITTKKHDQQPVISVPDVLELPRTHDDSFILMGCDGIWERYVDNNQKMVDYVKEFKDKYKDKKLCVEKFVDSLLGKSVKQHYGLDNMSAIFIDFV